MVGHRKEVRPLSANLLAANSPATNQETSGYMVTTKKMKICLAASAEGWVPFLDHELVEHAF
jgi:hypothetical protein